MRKTKIINGRKISICGKRRNKPDIINAISIPEKPVKQIQPEPELIQTTQHKQFKKKVVETNRSDEFRPLIFNEHEEQEQDGRVADG
jgi:hypothetical protein